jgi:hypothetical protein
LLKKSLFKGKKFIIAAVLVAVVLTATIGGVALANSGDDDTPPRLAQTELMAKVAELYQQKTGTTLDTDALEEAFIEAREELGLQNRERLRQRLEDRAAITQEKLDELKEWLEARPDVLSDEFKDWLESRPDIGRFGPRHGLGFGWCLPDGTAQ